MIEVARGEGAWLETPDGRRILDAISSWWVVTHGHRHPRIVAAIKEQADRLDQVIFAGFTHDPAERLARGLVSIAPPGLAHVFFSDSGSTSVEVALKMALGYWRNIGEPRTPHPRPGARLSRRHCRRHVGRRARCFQRALRAAAVRGRAHSVPHRRPRAGRHRRAGGRVRRGRRCRAHRRAVDPRRRRHAHLLGRTRSPR